jgi:hypothetical protein
MEGYVTGSSQFIQNILIQHFVSVVRFSNLSIAKLLLHMMGLEIGCILVKG